MATEKALNDASLLSLSGVRQLMFVEGAAVCQGDDPPAKPHENRLAQRVVINDIESQGELRKTLYFYSC